MTPAPPTSGSTVKTGIPGVVKAGTAIDLVAQGFDGTTVDDIAAAAEVSPRTFFRYFAAKDEALFDRAADVQEQFRALLASRPADEPLLVALREFLDEVAPAA